ncbi:MAG: 4-hydroxy-tetrahydrodipicolinate synthase [Gaiellaceae bacterium]|nr:4-hydroxy-tetrahydrodipicolinate synthase [Gaiellaceae bacterium]
MRVGSARARRQEQQCAATRTRLGVHGFDERAPNPLAAVRFGNDQRADLCSGAVVLDRRCHLKMREPDDLVAAVGDDDPVADDPEPFQSWMDGVGCGWIAELAEQAGDHLAIGRACVSDRHGHASRLEAVLGEVLTAIVTPFRADGSIDYDRFRELALHLVENGSDGIVVAGTTGESPTLSDDERLELFRVAVDALGGRATVVAGTGTYSTAHSVHLTKEAHEIGVDGLLVVTPYYNKPPQRGIVEHFKAIADASDKPIVVYNIPARVVINIEPETISELAKLPSVKAVKQANDDLAQARHIVDETGLDLYAGDDNLIHSFLELGGVGGVCVHTHVVGPQVKAMVRAYHEGDTETAKRIDEELRPAYELLKVQTNPIAIKAALNLLGHEVGGSRLPLLAADESEVAAVRACLEQLGVLAQVAA